MKAAILYEHNTPLRLEELDMPSLDFGQVLVKVMASGICGKQIGEINGNFGVDNYLPHLLGHEGAGVVVKVGIGVKKVKPDDRVILHWRKGSGIESNFPKYIGQDGKIIGGGLVTTFNNSAIVSENRLTKIESEISFDEAALLGCSLTTALGLINNEAKLKIGQSIAVFGAGGIGMSIIQGALLVSAFPIIAIDKSSDKLHKAMINGATHIINNVRTVVKKGIIDIVDKSGVDVFVDCTGEPRIISYILEMVKPGGKVILVGQPKSGSDLTISSISEHYDGKCIFASQGGLTNPDIDIPRYIRLIEERKINTKILISHKFKLEDINKALDVVRSGEAIRCIINMD
jgi:S-(hydroxymethyl)glutathione dehydrogenase/alcohol dehydrogenase